MQCIAGGIGIGWYIAHNSTSHDAPTAIGGSADQIFLIVGDLGSLSGEGLDFINGMTFLERFYSVYVSSQRFDGSSSLKSSMHQGHHKQTGWPCHYAFHERDHELKSRISDKSYNSPCITYILRSS